MQARRHGVALGIALALALGGCSVESCFRTRGIRMLREVSPGRAEQLLAEPGAILVQVGRPSGDLDHEPTVTLQEPDEPLPPELTAPEDVVLVVVVSAVSAQATRLAARLSRAGIQRVAVVREVSTPDPVRAAVEEPLGG